MTAHLWPHTPCDPAYLPDVDLIDFPYGYGASWREWQSFHGGGWRSLVRWVWNGGRVSSNEAAYLHHWRMIRRGECHVYNGHAWHFCDVHDVLQALERHL